jgi:hypothetical protein
LKRIEHLGYIAPYRTPGGHRRYSQRMLDEYLEKSKGFSYSSRHDLHGEKIDQGS